jgi:DNA-binding transcriptional LysR family regulator
MRQVAVNWDDLRYVLALRRTGSLGAAARSLKVESSTASRRLASLEASLGVQLVTRTPEGVTLNAAGTSVADLAETIDRGVEELERKIGGEDSRPEGIVKLATTDTVASFLMAGLIPLRDEHPKIQVQLVVGNAGHDLLRKEADIAVRMYRDQNPSLLTRKIGDLGMSLYGSRDLVARTGCSIPVTPDPKSLCGLPVIRFGEGLASSTGGKWLAANTRDEDVVLSGTSMASVINAVKAGLGISVLPCFTVHGDAALLRLTPEVVARVEAFLVIPPEHRDTVRVRLVMDAITALFQRERALLEGMLPHADAT